MDQERTLEVCLLSRKGAAGILLPKNNGYGSRVDALANLKGCSLMGYRPAEGVLIRKGDKLARIHSLIQNKPTPEIISSLFDNVFDDENYDGLFLACLIDEGYLTYEDLLARVDPRGLKLQRPLGTLKATGKVTKADPLAEGRTEGYFPPQQDLE